MHQDKHRVNAAFSGVGIELQGKEGGLQKFRSGINILQSQDMQIVQEANSIFEVYKRELEAMSKRITDNASQIQAVTRTHIGI